MIIGDNFYPFCTKTYVVTPHLNHLKGSDEGSQHKVSMRNKKNYPSIIIKYSSYPKICDQDIWVSFGMENFIL